MALYNDVTLYTTDTFSVWRDKYNQLIQQVLSQGLPNSTDTPIEFIQIEIPENDTWFINIPGVLVEKFKFDIHVIYKAVLNTTTDEKLNYPNDWYISEVGNLVLNTPLLPGDKISIRIYGVKDGKRWTDFYQKVDQYILSDLTYTTDSNTNTTRIQLPYIIDSLDTDVFINGVLLLNTDYSFTSGYLTVNSILPGDDVISFAQKIPLRDIEKYKVLSNGVLPDDYDTVKSILDNESLVVVEWFNNNYSEIIDPNIDVPTLTEAEYISRAILAGSPSLGSLNI